jgi:putative nucleotidyltransferase with HDIG domain
MGLDFVPMNVLNPTKDGLEAPAENNPAERFLDGVASLPPAPTLVTELLNLFRHHDCDVDQVVQLISYEPSLTAEILRSCHSVYFAGDEPPGDIFEAVSRIGFYQVYCLVVSVFGAKTRSIDGANEGVNVEESWRHSVTVAVSASVVAEAAGLAKTAAFTAGLLHDIGKLVLASAKRAGYATLIQRAIDEKLALSTMERSVLGIDHAELGGELMRRWNLPADVVAAVCHHHQLQSAPPHEHLTAAVQIGDMIAHHLCAESMPGTGDSAFSTALDVLQIGPDDLPILIDNTEAEMEKVKGMLEL